MLFFSHDTTPYPHHHPHGWMGFIIWLGCTLLYGALKLVEVYVLPLIPNIESIDNMVVLVLHLISGLSLTVGFAVGLLTLREKIKTILEKRKEKKES